MQPFLKRSLFLPVLAGIVSTIALPQIAHAQFLTLNGGDNLNVSGAGTFGILNGLPYDTPTTTYTTTDPIDIQMYTNAAFTLGAGGILSGGLVGLADQSSGPLLITGGSISSGEYGIYASGPGPITITGGSITGGVNGLGLLEEYSGGSIMISGGTFTAGKDGAALYAFASSGPVTIVGGTFTAGAGGQGLNANGAEINLFSQNDTPFLINGVPMNNMVLSGPYGNGIHGINGFNTISGILENGDILNTTFLDTGTINLNVGTPPVLPPAVPEASATVSFGLLLALGMGGLVVAKKRRKA